MEAALGADSDWESSDEETTPPQAVMAYLAEPLGANSNRYLKPHLSSQDLEDIALYKEAIMVNRQTQEKYEEFEAALYRALKIIREKLKENKAALLKKKIQGANAGFSYLRCGRPYFKDKNNFTPPDNEDTIMMKQADMYDFSQVSSVPGWTVKDKTELVNALLELSRDIKKKELYSKIAALRRENEDDNLGKITLLEKEISQLHKRTLTEIALPLDQEYDWEALANSLNRRHTAQEYQALWKLFFHPTINKSNWSKTEHQQLKKLASEFKMQDWDLIAKKLNTGRTGYQCFVYYRTNMTDTSSNRKWTPDEVQYLQRVIDYFREGTYIPWGKVATAMNNRTKIQVYNKYTRMIASRKGRFLEEEDIVILNCHDKYGDNFKKMAQFLPGRSPVQLKTRFNLLTKLRLSKTWTVEDDKKLIQIMANLDSNSSFSTATTHFPGKDRMHIRSRYITLMKWMKAHPATDLSMAPRRGARRLVHGHAAMNFNEAIINLQKRIKTEKNMMKSKRLTRFSDAKDIDVGIMALLMNDIIQEEANKKSDESEIEQVHYPSDHEDNVSIPNIDNLRKVLVFLNAKLSKDKFEKSKYAKLYPGLIEPTPDISQVKVKSYSKKEGVKTIDIDRTPDIWGNMTLPTAPSTCTLPPNYATLTGCRVLMKYVGALPEVDAEEEVNLSLMARKNSVLKESLCTLKERFQSLFMWPVLLSNEGPNVAQDDVLYIPRPAIRQRFLPEPDSVTIPPLKKTHRIFEARQAKKLEVDRHPKATNVATLSPSEYMAASPVHEVPAKGNIFDMLMEVDEASRRGSAEMDHI